MEQPTDAEKRGSILGSSPERPAPVGVTIRTTIEHGDAKPTPETFKLEITVLDVVRGKAASDHIKAEAISDQLPKAGFEYVLAHIRFGYFRKARLPSAPPSYALHKGSFGAASAEGKTEYENPYVMRQPQPQLIDMPLSVGDSRQGWILLEVPEEERKPLLVFHREHAASAYGIWKPVWFRLYSFDPMCIDGTCADCC